MISIIIPAYNVDQFLGRCLDSILSQNNFDNYKNELEIVIINDGSTDTTEEVALNYCNKYSFIKLYSQINGGLSAARNFGIECSSGKYIWFIDSDDWIANDSFDVLFNEIKQYDIDILEFDVVYALENNEQYIYQKDYYYSSIKTDLVSTKSFLEKEGYIVSVTSKLVKKTIFQNQNIKFPLKRFSEDNIVALKLMLNAKTFKKITKEIYFYYQRTNSITNNKNIDHIRKYIKDQILNIQDVDSEVAKYDINVSKIKEMQAFIVSNIILSLLKNKFSLKETNAFINEIEEMNHYPVIKYSYHGTSIKREIFRKMFNNRLLLN
ncbi:glycosyltransferase family 2 protein, partial [Elizabethkingia miricola]|uniref:glycosyltransferase family 2 protein n=2 Tax=Weeksellaceae TaxID=2762318 RepID=UPI0007416238